MQGTCQTFILQKKKSLKIFLKMWENEGLASDIYLLFFGGGGGGEEGLKAPLYFSPPSPSLLLRSFHPKEEAKADIFHFNPIHM